MNARLCRARASLAFAALLMSPFGSMAGAERLPLQNFTMRDGLPSDNINCLVRDRAGFLWICTNEGLAVYDGFVFRTFGPADGLPSRPVNTVLHARDGTYWIGTDDGLVRFLPAASPRQPRFTLVRPPAPTYWFPNKVIVNRVLSVLEDRSGRLWCGTAQAGLFTVESTDNELSLQLAGPQLPIDTQITALAEGEGGVLWIGTLRGLMRLEPDGSSEWFGQREGLSTAADGATFASTEVRSLLVVGSRVFVGTRVAGLHEIEPHAKPGQQAVVRSWRSSSTQGGDGVYGLIATSDGRLRYGGPDGAREVVLDDDLQSAPRTWGQRDGLGSSAVTAIAEDDGGHIWIGTNGSGLFRLRRGGFTTFTDDDGLAGAQVKDLFVAQGALHVVTASARGLYLNRFEGDRFTAAREPYHVDRFAFGTNQIAMHDRFGNWWFAPWPGKAMRLSARSIEQLPAAPVQRFGAADGLWWDSVYKVFEDSRGDVWLGTWWGLHNVSRWRRESNRFERHTVRTFPYEQGKGVSFVPEFFAEAPLGTVWVGGTGGVARFMDGRWSYFDEQHGLPVGRFHSLLRDARGRLWIGAADAGLVRVDRPDAERPVFALLRKADGLSSNHVLALTDDDAGYIYAGTTLGVDRIDPDTFEVRRYGVEDGLPGGRVVAALRDPQGDLWFGTLKGLSRFRPSAFKEPGWPELRLTRVMAPDLDVGLSDLGARTAPDLELQPHQNAVQVTVGALASGPMPGLRFEGRLEGAGSDWVPIEPGRPVMLLNLQPGAYRFVARATASGRSGPSTVSVAFTILRPWWQRPWALSLGALLLIGVSAVAYNLRVRHLLAIERVRSRIASDLHDDVGASLSRVALISEAARGHEGPDRESVALGALGEVAATVRTTATQMADIVWANDPRHDTVGNVIGRASWFASELFALRGTEWRCTVDETASVWRLGPEEKRQFLLLLKEALNNAAKHASARAMSLEARVDDDTLTVVIADDGCGFDPYAEYRKGATNGENGGHGLTNMATRARTMGGSLEVVSAAGSGCRITLRLPR